MKTLVLDGNNAVWRLQMKMPVLTANDQQIQSVYGFLRLLRGSLAQFEPSVALVCWDSGKSQHRIKLYKEYKGNRDHTSTPEKRRQLASFEKQVYFLKDVLRMLNIAQIAYPNTEADDLMGISCTALEGEKVIVSSDRDVLHLVNTDVSVWSPAHHTYYTSKNFYAKVKQLLKSETGLTPQQWLEFRAIVGDRGDNIPGVAKGLGEETAQYLIEKYGSIDTLFSASVEKKVLNKGGRYALLYSEGARERAYRNLLLMDLRLCAKHETGPKITKLLQKAVKQRAPIDKAKVREYFIQQKFTSLLKEMPSWISPFEQLDVKL